MNANTQVRRYFPSLLSYRRSEIDMENMDSIIQESGLGLFAVELKRDGRMVRVYRCELRFKKIAITLLKSYRFMK